jgi:hypothetical protein
MLGLAFAVLNVSHIVLYTMRSPQRLNAYFSHGLLYRRAYQLVLLRVVARASSGVCEYDPVAPSGDFG